MTLDARVRKVVIRRAAVADIEPVMALAGAAPAAAHWSHSAYESYILRELSNESAQLKALFVACVVVGNPETCLAEQQEIAGFVALTALAKPDGDCELENMAVAEAWRRRGIGSRLLIAGECWCRAQFASSLWLEVRASNSGALALYERAGFITAGHRPGYYTRPDEDAVQMRRTLSGHIPAC